MSIVEAADDSIERMLPEVVGSVVLHNGVSAVVDVAGGLGIGKCDWPGGYAVCAGVMIPESPVSWINQPLLCACKAKRVKQDKHAQ